jgi:hypothetical protein
LISERKQNYSPSPWLQWWKYLCRAYYLSIFLVSIFFITFIFIIFWTLFSFPALMTAAN